MNVGAIFHPTPLLLNFARFDVLLEGKNGTLTVYLLGDDFVTYLPIYDDFVITRPTYYGFVIYCTQKMQIVLYTKKSKIAVNTRFLHYDIVISLPTLTFQNKKCHNISIIHLFSTLNLNKASTFSPAAFQSFQTPDVL